MKANIQAVNFNIDKKLVNFIEERFEKTERFYDKVVSCNVFLKLDNTSDKENKIVELKINVPGDEYIVKKASKTFEEAFDLAANSVERLLVKHKEKSRV